MSKEQSLRIYLLAVCFVAMVCAAITTGMLLYSLLKIAAPEITLDAHAYQAHQSLDNFKRSHFNPANTAPLALAYPGTPQARAITPKRPGWAENSEQASEFEPPSDTELEKMRQVSYAQVLSNHRRSAVQNAIRLSLVLLVSAGLFFSHWRIARRGSDD
jgi:hypothetical protein